VLKKTNSERKKRSVICKKSPAQISAAWFCRKVAQFCPPGLLKRTCLIYFWMVRLHTRISSLRNSPRMRSAPQSRLFIAMSLINAMVSVDSFGCLESAFDLCFQNQRKNSRCERQQGLRLHNEERLLPCSNHPRAARTRRNLSVFRQAGRLLCRRRTMRGTRNNAFSTSSSVLPLARSATVPSRSEVLCGLIQPTKPLWSM
jgi:hypothetical protein